MELFFTERCHANLRKNLDAGVIRQYKASEAAGHAVMSAIKSLAEEIMVDSLERRRLLLETSTFIPTCDSCNKIESDTIAALLVTEQLNMPHKGVVVRYFRTFSTRTKDRTWVSGM